jgi:nucleotide-binding universal stress UspA family protein
MSPRSAAPIIVATDGRAESAGAIRLTQMLATRLGSEVVVVAVPEGPLGSSAARSAQLDAQVRARLIAVLGAATWPIEVVRGRPDEVFSRMADRHGARLIVMGASANRPVDRLLGHRTVLDTVARSGVPVMVVRPSAVDLPHRALVVVDDLTVGIVQAQATLDCLALPARMTLAHAATGGESPDATTRLSEEIIEGLDIGAGISIDTVTLTEATNMALQQCEREQSAELVVVAAGGTHGTSIGRLASTLLKTVTHCPIMVVPDTVARQERVAARRAIVPNVWTPMLDAFTLRNGGRLATVDASVDSAGEGGIQQEQCHLPFRGAVYDPRDERVEILLGGMGAESHLTRLIPSVIALGIHQHDGRDDALRVVSPDGLTVVRFAD